MKKTYLLLATLLTSTLSFGQNNQQPQPAETVVLPVNQTTVQEQTNRPIQQTNYVTSLVQTGASQGAHDCASHDLNEQHYASRGILNEFNQSYQQSASNAANLSFPETPGTNEISVIFHVVHNPNNPAENVSDAAILAVFQELRDDYLLLNSDAANARTGLGFNPANTNINFCLATQDPLGAPLTTPGIIRVSTTEDYYDHDGGEENKMKASATGGSEIWDRNKYLNVWICNITNGLNYGTAGYAYRPTTLYLPSASIDGIVLDYNIGLGSNVLTHEVGHYLGLDHTWGGSGGCGNDDSFTDTPNTDGPADQDPTFSCGMPSYQSCGAVEVQYENYMDYATGCTVMFTQEQANYMLLILQGIRGSLLLSPGCDPTDTPPNSAFTAVPAPAVIIPVNASVSLIDQSTNVPTGWAWTISGTQGVDWQWINTTDQNSQDPQAEFYNVGTYDVTLAASNGFGTDATPAIELNYISVVAGATGTACDTLRNWNPANNFFTLTTGDGYIHGNTTIGGNTVLEWAERYIATATTDIRAIEFAPTRVSDGGGSIIFKVYNEAAGEPSAVIASETVLLSDLTESAWNNIAFTTPATNVTGAFWVGYELSYANPLDTFALFSDYNNGTDYSYVNTTANGWVLTGTDDFGGAQFAGIIDVLTSTGPDPIMDFTASTDEVCINGDIIVNGSISQNNVDYRWYVTDDPWATTLETSSSSGNTFNFPYAAGSYNIYLFGDASCISNGVFMPVTVNDVVSATVTATATTCGNNDGSITISGETGGDLTTYYYSLDGVNYQAGNTFTALAPGDYDVYVATFGDNCEAMYTVTVLPSTAPIATATAGAAICPGGTTSVTATGGGTYQWFDGSNPVGTGASISVTPSATTQYDCIVTVGGCVTNAQATVTVNPLPPAPTVSAAGSTTICSGSSVDLTSSYPTDNVWSTTETSSTITVSTAGPVTVTHTDQNGCSNTSVATTIVVNNAPAISAGTVNGPSSCGTATGSIQVAGSGTGDVSWTGTATGNANGVTLPYTITGLAAGSYNITIVDGNGCTSNILAQGLNDPNPPTTPIITPSGAITFCDGGSVDLTSSYGTDNSWSTAQNTPTISVTTSQTISVTYTDGAGCSSTSTPIVVTVNANPAIPTITATGATTFCDGGSVDLTSSQGTGNTWSNSGNTQTISATQSGNYTVTYTDGNGCSATSAATVVTVNALPNVAMTALADVCDYFAAFTLSAGSPAGGTYSGTGVNGTDFEPATAGLGTHTITYSFTDANGCSNTADADILVDPCLSLEEQDNLGLNIFPNPTTEELNIVLSGDFTYSIVDARGRVITSGNGSQVVTLNTSSFETGVYFVTINTDNDTVVTRVVKQ